VFILRQWRVRTYQMKFAIFYLKLKSKTLQKWA
jgi:hypothetical protein